MWLLPETDSSLAILQFFPGPDDVATVCRTVQYGPVGGSCCLVHVGWSQPCVGGV